MHKDYMLTQELCNEINNVSGENSGQNSFLDERDEDLMYNLQGAGDKPLPLRRINRNNMYKRNNIYGKRAPP